MLVVIYSLSEGPGNKHMSGTKLYMHFGVRVQICSQLGNEAHKIDYRLGMMLNE